MAIKYVKLGRKIEDMPTELNYEVNSVKDVTGETVTDATIGTATTEASPVTFNGKDEFAVFLDTAIERGYELSQLEKWFTCVKPYKRVGTSFENGKPVAWRQKAVVAPGSYAPGNGALELSATLNWVGKKTFGTLDVDATGDKFVAESAPPLENQIHYKDGDASRSDFQIFYEHDTSPTV